MTETSLARTAAARGKVAPERLAHIVVRTKLERVAEMAAWYCTVLEAEVVFGNPFLQFLTYDEEHHRLAIVGQPGLGDRVVNTIGVHHVAFTYSSLKDLVHTYERLKANDIEPSICIHHGATVSMYFLDPDRNQVELQIEVFDSPEKIDAFLKSGHFAKNPIGVHFDPEILIRRFHEGVPEAEIKRPLEGPPPKPEAFPIH